MMERVEKEIKLNSAKQQAGTLGVVLFSGGLDSTLAIKVMQELGVQLYALTFSSPFCRCAGDGCGKKATHLAKDMNVPIKMIPLLDEYIEMIKNPKYGYGSGMNPCIDCRIMMFKKAKEYVNEIGASFIVTGEVLGQRPMSQNLRAMKIIERDAGVEGLVVRPLSAKLLPPTIPEQTGILDRQRLLNISGRSRKTQIELITTKYGIEDYACPAGGCLLTDPQYSKRLRDLKESGMLALRTARLLMYGRYFPLAKDFKLMVGRNHRENLILQNLSAKDDVLIYPEDRKGPLAVGFGQATKELIAQSCEIVKRYSAKSKTDIVYKIKH